jgi:hypothetical protein
MNLMLCTGGTLTRLPPDYDPGVGTLSRSAGKGLRAQIVTSQTPSPALRERGYPAREGWVGEGLRRQLLFGYDP